MDFLLLFRLNHLIILLSAIAILSLIACIQGMRERQILKVLSKKALFGSKVSISFLVRIMTS